MSADGVDRGEWGRPMSRRLDGKTAVITGGASGIGAGTAELFAEHGANVVVADLQEDAGRAFVADLAERFGDVARFAPCDVTSEGDVAAAVDLAVAEFGRLDIMFNNAGIVGVVGRISETDVDAWDHTMAILLRGVFLGTKHAARVMTASNGDASNEGNGGSGGVIINTSSVAGVVGGLGPHAYTTAKHAVVGMTRSVANELAPNGIRVNAISPGSTVTAMTAKVTTGDADDVDGATDLIASGSPLGVAGLPADIAAAALYLASDDARYVSGHNLVVDAGLTTAGAAPTPFNVGRSRQFHEAGRVTD